MKVPGFLIQNYGGVPLIRTYAISDDLLHFAHIGEEFEIKIELSMRVFEELMRRGDAISFSFRNQPVR